MMAVGFSQRVRWEWLDRAAELKRHGESDTEITEHLTALIGEHLSKGNDPERGNRDKAVSILRRVWLTPSPELRPLRDAGLALLGRTKGRARVSIHWGQVVATYPFWGVVADLVGRLVSLHDQVSPVQVQRRLRDRFGERETVARAARRILRSFHDWGVAVPGPSPSTYALPPERIALSAELTTWLAEAVVWSQRGQSIAAAQLVDLPALFPFRLDPSGLARAEHQAGVEYFTDTDGAGYLRLRPGLL